MTTPAPRPVPNIQLEVPADVHPVYANLARISHAPAEFVLDFARYLPGDAKAVVTARVIMSPVALKLFIKAVTENMARFEQNFGPINLPSGGGASLADQLFRHPNGPPEPPEDKK